MCIAVLLELLASSPMTRQRLSARPFGICSLVAALTPGLWEMLSSTGKSYTVPSAPFTFVLIRLYNSRIDLDIEGGTSAHYSAFVNKIRSLSSGADKQ